MLLHCLGNVLDCSNKSGNDSGRWIVRVSNLEIVSIVRHIGAKSILVDFNPCVGNDQLSENEWFRQ